MLAHLLAETFLELKNILTEKILFECEHFRTLFQVGRGADFDTDVAHSAFIERTKGMETTSGAPT